MTDLELAVVGAGPQALTLLCYVSVHRPELLERTVVFDDQPWLAGWHAQFARLRIPILRSACVHHPHPDPYGLIRFAREHGRTGEFNGTIGRPGTKLFGDYCDWLIGSFGLEELRRPERVADVVPQEVGAVVVTGSGTWRARRVVLATNPLRPVLPPWFGDARAQHRGAPGLEHSRDWAGPGGDAVVVGGGLTAAQIVMAHAEHGDRVTWVTRSPLRERDLDVEPQWLGPRLRGFHDTPDARARVSQARRARGGGTLPADERQRMLALAREGRVTHLQGPVDGIRRAGDHWRVTVRYQGAARKVDAARVVCATGTATHVRTEPLLRRCRTQWPARRVAGLPVLEPDLAWPGTAVHLMGPLAVTQVGPATRTVIGARISAERLLCSWGVELRRQYPGPNALP